MRNDPRKIVQVSSDFNVDELNNALRYICEMIYKQEGRTGPLTLRDTTTILADTSANALTMQSTNSLVRGKQLSLGAAKGEILRGVVKQGELYIPTATSAQIISLEDPDSTYGSSVRIYLDTELTVGVPYIPTMVYSFGTAGLSGETVLAGIKTDTQTIQSELNLQDITSLSFDIGAGESWIFEFGIFWTANATPDIVFSVNAPASPTQLYFGFTSDSGLLVSGSASDTAGTEVSYTGTTGLNYLTWGSGSIINGTTAGSVTAQFAQRATSATDVSIFPGSYYTARRVA